MKANDYIAAAGLLKEIISYQNGAHVIPLIDLASCYYMIGDYSSFKKFSQLALNRKNNSFEVLSELDQSRVILGLGRLLEEMGYVTEALALYKEVNDYSSTIQRKKILAQKLRLESELGLKGEILLNYNSILRMYEENGDMEVDFLNAILYAEYHLFGFEIAYERYFSIQKKFEISESDQRLLFFNLLFLSLRDKIITEKIMSTLNSFDYFKCDNFEKALYNFSLLSSNQAPLQSLTINNFLDLSPFCQIRFLFLLSQYSKDPDDISKARILVCQFLNEVSPKSKSLIKKSFKYDDPEEITIYLNKDLTIYKNTQIDFGKSNTSRKFLNYFINQKSILIDELCNKLFSSEAASSEIHRLRMMIQRLNKKLEDQIGISGVFKMNKIEVTLLHKINIKEI